MKNKYYHQKGPGQRIEILTLETIDRLIVLLVIGIALVGGYTWLRASLRARHGMIGMGTMPEMDPIWYIFGTVIAISVVLGVYVLSRENLARELSSPKAAGTTIENRSEQNESASQSDHCQLSDGGTDQVSQYSTDTDSTETQVSHQTYLPEDEQRVLKPVFESPSLTQVELRGQSDFSKAKVSQTMSELGDRGLLYREKQGRTYCIYPGALLSESLRNEGDADE